MQNRQVTVGNRTYTPRPIPHPQPQPGQPTPLPNPFGDRLPAYTPPITEAGRAIRGEEAAEMASKVQIFVPRKIQKPAAPPRREVITVEPPKPQLTYSGSMKESQGNPMRAVLAMLAVAKRYLDDTTVFHSGRLTPEQQHALNSAVYNVFVHFPFDITQQRGSNIVDSNQGISVGKGFEKATAYVKTGWSAEHQKYFLSIHFQDGMGDRKDPSRATGALVNNVYSTIFISQEELSRLMPGVVAPPKESNLDRFLRNLGWK